MVVDPCVVICIATIFATKRMPWWNGFLDETNGQPKRCSFHVDGHANERPCCATGSLKRCVAPVARDFCAEEYLEGGSCVTAWYVVLLTLGYMHQNLVMGCLYWTQLPLFPVGLSPTAISRWGPKNITSSPSPQALPLSWRVHNKYPNVLVEESWNNLGYTLEKLC